jgi:uncharacterized membrane protein YhaH (DUF805 family)
MLNCKACQGVLEGDERYCPYCGTCQEESAVDTSEVSPEKHTAKPLTVAEVLFSFEGRLSRRDYWLKGAVVMLPFAIINNILALNQETYPIASLLSLLALWPTLALLIKRLRDHDRSGWYICTMLIPFAGLFFAIWIIILVWFIEGTDGPNRYGDKPV